jgi:hypothetical protein
MKMTSLLWINPIPLQPLCQVAPSFLNIPYSPVRKMLNNNLAIALASDYNPGSTPSGNMQFVNSLACIQMKLNSRRSAERNYS